MRRMVSSDKIKILDNMSATENGFTTDKILVEDKLWYNKVVGDMAWEDIEANVTFNMAPTVLPATCTLEDESYVFYVEDINNVPKNVVIGSRENGILVGFSYRGGTDPLLVVYGDETHENFYQSIDYAELNEGDGFHLNLSKAFVEAHMGTPASDTYWIAYFNPFWFSEIVGEI